MRKVFYILLVLVLMLGLSSVAFADDEEYYSSMSGFKYSFFTTSRIEKTTSSDWMGKDDNINYRRVSDNATGSYSSRLYTDAGQKAANVMYLDSGDDGYAALWNPWHDEAGGLTEFKLKLYNGTGVKYWINGYYKLY